MGKYIKFFETHADYEAYINGSDKVLPNVSCCEYENDCHYNPWTDPKLVCKYSITDTSSATALRTEYEPNMFKSMEIDGVLLDNMVTEYQFSTTGEHTVKYELYDDTKVGNNAPLFNNITTLSSVSIPNSVTTIGQNAFMYCSGITSVTIPDSVTSIGNQAFLGCSGLTSITIPNSVTTIGRYAFNGCSGLTSVTIPNSVTTIGENAFDGCSGLTSVTLNTNANAVFSNLLTIFGNQVTEYVIGNNVTSIIEEAFRNCTGLTSVTIPNSVTSIGSYAFQNCSGLISITIPYSVTSIGSHAFAYCICLKYIRIMATTAPTIENYTFYTVNTNGTLTVPSGSTGYDVWMGTGDYYLGKYNWTKVEQ